MKDLSFDAQYLAGSLFAMMVPGEGTLTFGMKQSRPTQRTQAALDELVEKGAVSVRPFNQFGGFVYTPQQRFKRPTKAQEIAAGKWNITEPVV